MKIKFLFALLLNISLTQESEGEADKCSIESLPKFNFGYFKCKFRGRGGKCTGTCEDGFQIKQADKQITCKKIKKSGKLEWRPKKYANTCTPVKPAGCPMPNRIGSGVEILESWLDDEVDAKYGGGWTMRVTVRPDAAVEQYSVVVIFDKAMSGYDLFATTMRVAKVNKRSVTFVNEFYNGNTTDIDVLSFLVTARAKRNKPLKKGPISATAGFYGERIGDASCILSNMQQYKKLPTDLPTTTTKQATTTTTTVVLTTTAPLPTINSTCIFENGCTNSTDREVDDVPEIYFFPGGEANCPIGDFSRANYRIIEHSSSSFVVNVLINGNDGNLFTDQAAVLMFDDHIDHLDFETDYMDVVSVEKNLVLMTSKQPTYQHSYHTFAVRASGFNAQPLGATVAVFDYHPENVTCWSMENAIFNNTIVEYASTTASPTTANPQVATTTAPPTTMMQFTDEICSVEATSGGASYNIVDITAEGWNFEVDFELPETNDSYSALVIFDDNIDLYDELTELSSNDVRIRLRRNNMAILEGISTKNLTITVRTVMEPLSATLMLLNKNVLTENEIDCFAEKFALKFNKEPTTCQNLFPAGHVEFGSDQVQYQHVSKDGFNMEVKLRPRDRHYREWGLVMIFDENIDLYDELIEINSIHLAVKGRKGNVVFFDGQFELERNTAVSVLIQFRTSMGMMGATVAFIDIQTDSELQSCISEMFHLSTMTTTTTVTTTTTTTTTTKKTDVDNTDGTDSDNDNESSTGPDNEVAEGTCPSKVNFGAHIVEVSIDDDEGIYDVTIDNGQFTPDEWGLLLMFDDEISTIDLNDNVVLIDKGETFALLQGVGQNSQISFTTDVPTGTLVGYINGFIDNQVITCIKQMTGIEAAKSTTTSKDVTTTITTTSTTLSQVDQQCVTYENEKWVSGSIKNAEWQQGSNYKFNRHVYIPLNGATVTNWEILLEFSDPVFDIEVWTVKSSMVDQEGRLWKFTSLNDQPKSVTEDPWVFNFLGQSAKPGSTLEVSFCVFD